MAIQPLSLSPLLSARSPRGSYTQAEAERAAFVLQVQPDLVSSVVVVRNALA